MKIPLHPLSRLRDAALLALAAALLPVTVSVSGQELIYQEGFNTDGSKANPARYTIVGGDVWELSRIFGDPPLASASAQRGPVYFAHNFDVSFVGIPNIPGRRMMLCWRANNDISTTTEDFLTLLDSAIAWLVNNKANGKVMVYPDVTAIGGLKDRFEAAGWTVLDDDTTKTDAQLEADADLFIHAGNADPSRYALLTKPVVGNFSSDWDDMIIGSIGSDATFAPGKINIGAVGHPAAGGKTGSFDGFTGDHAMALAGRFLPEGSTLLATVNRTVPPSVVRLSDVDDMIAGTKQHDESVGTLASLDINDGSPGNWPDDNGVPGGYTGSWGLRVQGKLTVSAAGTYRFALGTDDGARFQIDQDKNGFTFADNIIEDFGPHIHTLAYENVTFATAGTYDFEVRSYSAASPGSFELSVGNVPAAEVLDDDLASGYWELLGTAGGTAPVQLTGTATTTGYLATGADTETKEPLIVLLNGPSDTPPGAFYGGGPLTGFEGTGFFAGAGMNKFPYENDTPPRSVTLRSVNVSGKTDVRLTVALAGAQIDFENDANDFLDINIRPNGEASAPITLAHFNGVETGQQPWLADDLHGNQRRLTREFADFTYNIPANATDLIVEFVAGSSWWNELLGFDNVRITAGTTTVPMGAITATATGDNLNLTWTGGTAPYLVQGKLELDDPAWIDLQTVTGTSTSIPMAALGGVFRVQDGATKTVKLFKAALNGANERPTPNTQPGTGVGLLALDGLNLTYVVSYQNLSATPSAQHLHGLGTAEQAVGTIFTLQAAGTLGTSGLFIGTATVDAATAAGIADSKTYFNIHTPGTFSNGEIRGQVVPVP